MAISQVAHLLLKFGKVLRGKDVGWRRLVEGRAHVCFVVPALFPFFSLPAPLQLFPGSFFRV